MSCSRIQCSAAREARTCYPLILRHSNTEPLPSLITLLSFYGKYLEGFDLTRPSDIPIDAVTHKPLIIRASTQKFGTYGTVKQQSLWPVHANAQTGQSFHCLHTPIMDVDEDSDQTLDL